MQFYKSILATFLASSLVACGGSLEGGSTTDDATAGDDTAGTVVDDAAPAKAGVPSSIAYTGASQPWVAIKGTGGADRRESSVLTFQLLDSNGDGITGNKEVTFYVDAPSGTTLNPLKGTTNDEGFVSTTVSSGKVPGPVTVHAQLTEEDEITAISGVLAVTSGLPDQNSFSLSVTERAPEAWNTDGVIVGVTARLADHWNNTVPDGTVVFFHTEGGKIRNKSEPIGFCETVLGACSVEWVSSAPRPADGRITITAYADGEESFVDKDGDGWFSEGDIFTVSTSPYFNNQTDLGEVFYDFNRNGIYDEGSSEEFKDTDTAANPLDGAYNEADGLFTGVLCSDIQESLGNCIKSLVQVRQNTEIVMSSDKLACGIYIGDTEVTGQTLDLTTESSGKASYQLKFVMMDQNGNTPPEGTSAVATTENGELSGGTSWNVVPANDLGVYVQTVTLMRESEPNNNIAGELALTLTTPGDVVSTCALRVIDDEPPEPTPTPVPTSAPTS